MTKLDDRSLSRLAPIARSLHRNFVLVAVESGGEAVEIDAVEGLPGDIGDRSALATVKMMVAIDVGVVATDPLFE